MADDLDALHQQLLSMKGSPAAPKAAGQDLDALWAELKGMSGRKAEPQRQTSPMDALWESIKRGTKDVGENIGQHIETPEEAAFQAPQERIADTAMREQQSEQAEKAYQASPGVQQHPLVSGLGRLGANVAASAPFMAAGPAAPAGLVGRTGMGIMKSGLTGGLPGAGIGGGLSAIGSMIGPSLSPEFQAIARKYPNLAQMATGALGRTKEAFQQATANEVLQPLKQTVSRTIKAGHDLVNEVGDRITDAYNRVLPKVTFRANEINPETGRSFTQTIPELAENVPEAHQNDFTKLVRNQITKRVDADGNMTGQEFKRADAEIGRLAARYGASPDAGHKEYGDVLRDLQANMRDTLRIHNPGESQELTNVDQAWARYVRMQEASGRGPVEKNGEFMPNDLLMAVRSTTRGARNRVFSGGDNLMQGFGRAGNDLLAGRPPAFNRYLADIVGGASGAGLGGVAGHVIGGPVGGYAGASIGAAAGTAMAEGGRRLISGLQARPGARAIGGALSRISPVAGGALPGAEDTGEAIRDRYVSPAP